MQVGLDDHHLKQRFVSSSWNASRESHLGRAPHPRRAFEAQLHPRAVDGFQGPASQSETALPELADVLAKSSSGRGRHRLRCGIPRATQATASGSQYPSGLSARKKSGVRAGPSCSTAFGRSAQRLFVAGYAVCAASTTDRSRIGFAPPPVKASRPWQERRAERRPRDPHAPHAPGGHAHTRRRRSTCRPF